MVEKITFQYLSKQNEVTKHLIYNTYIQKYVLHKCGARLILLTEKNCMSDCMHHVDAYMTIVIY